MRVPSMFKAPVPCASTFPATVPLNGFLATTTGSYAGLRAVPQPSHCAASGVAGAVTSGIPPVATCDPSDAARLPYIATPSLSG